MTDANVETICRCGHSRWEHTRKGIAAVNYCGQCGCMDFRLPPVFGNNNSKPVVTNRMAHEEAAGMGLCDQFFTASGIDPEAPYVESEPA